MVRLRLGARGVDRQAAHREPDPFLLCFAAVGGAWELAWSTIPSRKTTDPVFNGACVGAGLGGGKGCRLIDPAEC